jgi:hypothetical protein
VSKFTETEYMSTKEILKFPDHYVALAVMVDDSGVSAVDGKKIVPRGAIVGGSDASAVDNLNKPVVDKYVAAVKASLVCGTAGETSAVKLEALAAGDAGESISITIVDPGTASAELGVVVSNKDITVNLATDASSDESSTAKQVADAINADAAAKLLVVASYYGDGSGIVEAKTKTTLANGGDSAITGAEGVLMNDVDVTYGPSEGAMIIHGFIAVDKMPYADNDDAAAKAGSALPMIKFIK